MAEKTVDDVKTAFDIEKLTGPAFGDLTKGYEPGHALTVISRWGGIEGDLAHFTFATNQNAGQAMGIFARAIDQHHRALFAAASRGFFPTIMHWIEKDLPVNLQHPTTALTLLHVAAASNADRTVRVLLASGRCNVLLRDRKGRLAWELCDDDALSRLLMEAQVAAAKARGERLRFRA